MKKLFLVSVLVLTAFLSGCATVPLASLEQDQQAKTFTAAPDKSNIYVYRNQILGGAVSIPVTLDGKIIGQTGSKTYFLLSVEPGPHVITSLSENTAEITVDAQAGKNHFIRQVLKMGWLKPRTDLRDVSDEEGRKGVQECKLIESELLKQ